MTPTDTQRSPSHHPIPRPGSDTSPAQGRADASALRPCLALGLGLCLGFTPLLSPAAAPIDDRLHQWPQWRGPLANGVAPNADPPVSWSETEHVKWRFEIPGSGTSTPIIWGDQVFILSAVPTGKKVEPPAASAPPAGGGGGRRNQPPPTEIHQWVVIAVDRETGKLRWQKSAREELPHEGHHRDHGFASFSPVSDGEHLFAHFGSRGLYAFDHHGGLKWEKDFGDMRTVMGFGEGGSLALHGDTLVVNWDHEGDDFIAALDKRTGRELWRQPRDEATTWSTPLIVVHEGKPQVIVSATERIRCYELATGKQLWECGGLKRNVIPTPVADASTVYAMSGYNGSALLAIRLGRTGDLTDTDAVAWRRDKSTPYVPSPLLYGDRLYYFAVNSARLSCFDTSMGTPLIDAENIEALSQPGVYASPLGASGRIYLVGRNGQTVVLKRSDQLEILATNKLDDQFEASPAAVGDQLFLRGHRHLYCLASSR